MSKALAFSVRIFIPTGEPEGLRVIKKSNWTGQGLFFPRSIYLEARKREELRRTGVYILWGPSGSGQMQKAYVGQSGELRARLNEHQDKEFWTHAVAFTSNDQSLNKAHVLYLESELVSLATEAKRCILDNANVPQPPPLSEEDVAVAKSYLADMLLCLPVVGVSFFEKPEAREEESKDLLLESKGIRAHGYEDVGGFVVRAGSQAVREELDAIRPHLSTLREDLKSQGILEDDGTVLRLAKPYVFNSPSTASGVLLGRSSNGRIEWKDAEGRSLKEIQSEDTDME